MNADWDDVTVHSGYTEAHVADSSQQTDKPLDNQHRASSVHHVHAYLSQLTQTAKY